MIFALCRRNYFQLLYMKKHFTLALLAASLMSVGAQVTIVNGHLENWNTYSGFGGASYIDLGPNQDRTKNFLRTLNEILEAPLTPQTAARISGTGAYAGDYSVRLRTGLVGPILVPGYLGTGDVDISNQTIYLGRPYTDRPQKLEMWYKYEGVSGDSGAVEVEFTRYNALTQQTEQVGYAKTVITNNISTWTLLELDIAYSSMDAPDSVNIIVCASANYDLVDFQNGQGQVGSDFFVDNISFVFPASVENLTSDKVNIFPTVASDVVRIDTDLNEPFRIRIYDLSGRRIQDIYSTEASNTIDVSSFRPGAYVVVIQTDFHRIATGRIIKQ
jgi:hypothetical protein